MMSSASYMLDIQVSRDAGGNRKRDDLRANTLQLMLEQLKHVAASRPCLLVIEDLQWIDPTSRELLEAIVQLAADLSLFVLVTSRPGPAEESMIAAFRGKPNVAIYRLGPLSEEHSSAIIVNAFEGMHCPPSVAAAIVKRTEPDRLPFYLEELAHFVRDKLAAQGNSLSADDAPQAIHGEQAMPVNLEMFLRETLDRLSPAAKALAQIASAVGSGFSRSLLQSVCRFAPDDFEQAFVELVEEPLHHRIGCCPVYDGMVQTRVAPGCGLSKHAAEHAPATPQAYRQHIVCIASGDCGSDA